MDDWFYGRLTRASAFRLGDRLIVRVEGVKPTPCHQVELREYVPDPRGSADVQLGLYWRQTAECPPRRTRYVARVELRVGGMAVDRVRIDNARRPLDVRARPIAFAPPSSMAAEAGELYTGWSRASFQEAYRKAVALIPLRHADELVHARIVDQGGLHGGEAGLDDLFVTVRRVHVAPRAESKPQGRDDGASVPGRTARGPRLLPDPG